MMKAGATKTTDIMIPQNENMTRLKNFFNVYSMVSKEAGDNLNYNMAMFVKEKDFLRYLRMNMESSFL